MLPWIITALTTVPIQSPDAIGVKQSLDPATLGPRVGEALPAFEVRDQDGRLREFSSLTGPNGLVLVFFRSADW
jgi:hypothetical protein